MLSEVWVICYKFIFFMTLTTWLIKILYQYLSIIINIFWFWPIMQIIFSYLGNHLEIGRLRDSIIYFWSNYSAGISAYMISPNLSILVFLIYFFNCFFICLFGFYLYFILCKYFTFTFLCFTLNLHLLTKYNWITNF